MYIIQESFKQEAEEYECSVEKLYPLCYQCEQKVTNEISRRNHMMRPHLLNNAIRVRRNEKVSLSQYYPWRGMCGWRGCWGVERRVGGEGVGCVRHVRCYGSVGMCK